MEMLRRPLDLTIQENIKLLREMKHSRQNEHEERAIQQIEPTGEGNRHERRREAALRRKERV